METLLETKNLTAGYPGKKVIDLTLGVDKNHYFHKKIS